MAELGSVSAVVRTSRVRSLLDRCPLQVASGPSRRCDPGLDGGGRRFNSWVGSCAPLPETGDQHRPRLTEQRRRGEAAGDKYLSPGKKGRRGQEKREAAVVVTQPCSPSRTNFHTAKPLRVRIAGIQHACSYFAPLQCSCCNSLVPPFSCSPNIIATDKQIKLLLKKICN